MAERATLLVHSGWQGINIGDIAHSPGVLRVLQRRYPEARLLYWPRTPDEPAERMIEANFPDVPIVRGECDHHAGTLADEVAEAFKEADVFVHGSGGGLAGSSGLMTWRDRTGKPFGMLGVGAQEISDTGREIFAGARFAYTRETQSLKNLAAAGIQGPEVRFVPDGTFACDLRDDETAARFRAQHGLEPGGYICVIPRLRYTPYHRINDRNRTRKGSWTAEKIAHVEAVNARYAEQDHAKLREAIVRWVRETALRVLLCVEMSYQLELIRPLLFEPLPDDVKPLVVPRSTYWRTDEAASIYRDACAVISIECHSPILALQAGTPAFYVRQPEDTIKGQMYYDLGLSDWVFEIDQTQGSQIADRLMEVHGNPQAAEATRAAAMAQADALFASIDLGI